MNHLIVGLGEVGSGLRDVLVGAGLEVGCLDPVKGVLPLVKKLYDVMHVCIPYDEDFVETVGSLEVTWGPDLIIIHSTVPLGTTARIEGAVHSPIRGAHPNLAEGIRTFPKWFGGPRSQEAAEIFAGIGIRTCVADDSKVTEALKLWDTTQYGWMIILEKEMWRWCREKFGDARAAEVMGMIYRGANEEYNEGYRALNRPEVQRPVLKHQEGKIGGHCVIPNARLLSDGDATVLPAFLLAMNNLQ